VTPDPRRFKPLMHPAGSDIALAKVLGDVHSGRWMAMAALLNEPMTLQTWCTRTALLGKVAAPTNTVEEWLRERPTDRDALALMCRVLTERACRAIEAKVAGAGQMESRAATACHRQSQDDPADPVPYLSLLALACARGIAVPGPDACPVPGPWDAFRELWRVDGGNREAYHRMMTAIASRHAADAQLFAQRSVAAAGVSAASPLQMLPLYALIGVYEHHKRTRPGELTHLLWTTESALRDVERGWIWFQASDPAERLVVDLSHLAHALAAAGWNAQAAEVFAALGPYGSPRPWQTVSADGDGAAELVRVRLRVLSSHRPRAGP
jgi:hypothetical protein